MHVAVPICESHDRKRHRPSLTRFEFTPALTPLGGSWVVISGVIWVITTLNPKLYALLIAPLITTH